MLPILECRRFSENAATDCLGWSTISTKTILSCSFSKTSDVERNNTGRAGLIFLLAFTVFDLIGGIGVAMIIVTYFLLQTNRIESAGRLYSILNAVGAGLILISLWFDFNLAAFVVEFFWLAISIYGIVKSLFSH